MAIGAKLRDIRKQNGLSVQHVAQQVGVSAATLYRYENGSIEKIPSHVLTELARVLGVTPAQIIGWDDSIFSIPGVEPAPAMRTVPRLGNIACGEPILASAADADFTGYTLVGTQIPCDFALRCEGDSMVDARIYDGDIVFIHKQDYVDDGTIAAVLIDDDATLKRVYRLADGRIELRAANARYAPILIGGEGETRNVRILGKAVAFQGNII